MNDLVVIVSGSRHATPGEHRRTISDALMTLSPLAYPGRRMQLVHGDAPGVDHIARDIVTGWGWDVVAVPADWVTCGEGCPPGTTHRRRRIDGGNYCPAAGPRRNRLMVDSYGPDAWGLLTFPHRGAAGMSGTWRCMTYAADQGLHIVVSPLTVTKSTKETRRG